MSKKLFVGGGGARIMDLDQYLEKMNTNTKIIWIQNYVQILYFDV